MDLDHVYARLHFIAVIFARTITPKQSSVRSTLLKKGLETSGAKKTYVEITFQVMMKLGTRSEYALNVKRAFNKKNTTNISFV